MASGAGSVAGLKGFLLTQRIGGDPGGLSTSSIRVLLGLSLQRAVYGCVPASEGWQSAAASEVYDDAGYCGDRSSGHPHGAAVALAIRGRQKRYSGECMAITGAPFGIPLVAHLDYAAVQRGDIAEHEWRGNRLADRLEAEMLRQGIRDCDELPKRDRSEVFTQEATREPGTRQGHKRRCVQVWQAPEWVHELARSRDLEGELEQGSTQQNHS
eukprot:4944294-Amphidinium_carterae.1